MVLGVNLSLGTNCDIDAKNFLQEGKVHEDHRGQVILSARGILNLCTAWCMPRAPHAVPGFYASALTILLRKALEKQSTINCTPRHIAVALHYKFLVHYGPKLS